MGTRLNKIKKVLLKNWDLNQKKIIVAIGTFLIALCMESIAPVSELIGTGTTIMTFLVSSYKYLMALIIFIIGAVFGKQESTSE